MRHSLLVFHEATEVETFVRAAARGWRTRHALSVERLEAELRRDPPEILVTDAEPYGVPLRHVVNFLGDGLSPISVHLCLSDDCDQVALVNALMAGPRRVYAGAVSIRSLSPEPARTRRLGESLCALRLQPYASAIVRDCADQLELRETPFHALPRLLMDRPWSFRRPAEAARALRVEVPELAGFSRTLGYPRTDRLLFRIRATLAALLVATGEYSWAEARETFGHCDGQNFRRRLRSWFGARPDALVRRKPASSALTLIAAADALAGARGATLRNRPPTASKPTPQA